MQESSGKRVMGLAKNAIATKVAVPPHLLFQVPQQWSLAEAASVPIAYLTSYYALIMRGQVRKGMRVLVHSGTGAVGLAAIRICLYRGAEVIITPCLLIPCLLKPEFAGDGSSTFHSPSVP